MAGQNGITVVIEPIIRQNTNVVNTVGEAVGLARQVARPEVNVLVDLYHMTGVGERPEAAMQAGSLLAHVHMPVPEVPRMNEPRSQTGGLPHYDIPGFLAALRAVGYDHRLTFEDLDRRFMNLEREGPMALEYTRALWGKLGGAD